MNSTFLDSAAATAARYDPRTRGFGIGRTLIALAQIATLLFTDTLALMAPVLGTSSSPNCAGSGALSLYCVAPGVLTPDVLRWVLIASLAVVASGWRPRWTVLPHFWISFSIALSIALPDGGESVAKAICFLIIPIGLADNRTWHWNNSPADEIGPSASSIAFVFFWGVRIQMAGIYLHSAISKLGVEDWVNGSAEYYFVRDGMFGVAEPFSFFVELTKIPVITAGMTWGAIVLEIVIALLYLTSFKWRRVALPLDILLHSMIIITIGLWSFALIMIGSSFIAVLAEARHRDSDTDDGLDTTPALDASETEESIGSSPKNIAPSEKNLVSVSEK